MRRSPLRPGTKGLARSPLRRGTTLLRRKTRLNPVDEERAARLRREQFGGKAEWIRSLPCATCPRRPPSDPSHVKTRGAGGKAKHLIPQCHEDHVEFHSAGIETFHERRGLASGTLLALAEEYSARWEALPPEEWERWERVYRRKHVERTYETDSAGIAAALEVWPDLGCEGSNTLWTLKEPGPAGAVVRLVLTRSAKWRLEIVRDRREEQ